MSRLFTRATCAFCIIGGIAQQSALSQERTFSLSGSVGYGFLRLSSVDEKNASDVVGWTDLGIPLPGFSSVKQSPFFSARATYRYTRDFAIALSGSYFSENVSTAYDGPDATLRLDRSVGATDLALSIAYFPAVQSYYFQWYLRVNAGVLLARATADAVGEQGTKPAGVVVMVPLVNSEGKYKRTGTSAAFFVGADVPLLPGIFLNTEAGYRVANAGQLDGDITRFGVQSNESSTTTFDFSGFLVSAGVGIEL